MNDYIKHYLVCVLLIVGTLSAKADYDFEVNNINYNIVSLKDRTCEVCNPFSEYYEMTNSNYTGDFVIPSVVNYNGTSFTVVGIGASAFINSDISSITIPNTVTTIGQRAFKSCKELRNVKFSNQLVHIEKCAFLDCISLKTIKLPSTLSGIGVGAFYGCSSLKGTFINPSSSDGIGSEAFADTKISTVIIPYRGKMGSFYLGEYCFPSADSIYMGTNMGYYVKNDHMADFNDVFFERDEIHNSLYDIPKVTFGDSVVYMPGMGERQNQQVGVKKLTIGYNIQRIPLMPNHILGKIFMRNPTPPLADGFTDRTYVNAILYVPKGAKSAYKSSHAWEKFINIQEYDVNLPSSVQDFHKKVLIDGHECVEIDGLYWRTKNVGASSPYDAGIDLSDMEYNLEDSIKAWESEDWRLPTLNELQTVFRTWHEGGYYHHDIIEKNELYYGEDIHKPLIMLYVSDDIEKDYCLADVKISFPRIRYVRLVMDKSNIHSHILKQQDERSKKVIMGNSASLVPDEPGQPVDLGLSVKWASHNIGATILEEAGVYYKWGDVYNTGNDTAYSIYGELYDKRQDQDYYKRQYDLNTFSVLRPSDDVATYLWKGNWRIPTAFEYEELIDRCQWVWDYQKLGYKVIGPNGNSIFIPAAGCQEDDGSMSDFYTVGERGLYWCSTYTYSRSAMEVGPDFLMFAAPAPDCECVESTGGTGGGDHDRMPIRPVWSTYTSEQSLRQSIGAPNNVENSHSEQLIIDRISKLKQLTANHSFKCTQLNSNQLLYELYLDKDENNRWIVAGRTLALMIEIDENLLTSVTVLLRNGNSHDLDKILKQYKNLGTDVFDNIPFKYSKSVPEEQIAKDIKSYMEILAHVRNNYSDQTRVRQGQTYVQPSILLSSELDAANAHVSQVVQQHNEVIGRSPYTQYLNKSERNRFMPTYTPMQIPDAYDYDQAKAFCDSLQRVADSLSQQDPAMTVASIKDYLRSTRPDNFVKAYFQENSTAKVHLESEHKEYRCHYALFTDFVIQYEQGRLQPSERNCRELKWQEYNQYYSSKEAFNADYDKGDEHLEAHKRREQKWVEYEQYYSSRDAFNADYNKGDETLEAHKKREIKWAECADYYASRNLFNIDYDQDETAVDAHRRRIDEAWSQIQNLPEKILTKKNLKGARDSKKAELLNLVSLYHRLDPSPVFQLRAADFLISHNKKMGKEYKKKGSSFSSKIEFVNAYFADYYKSEAEEDKRVEREIKRIERKHKLAAKRANHEQQRQEQKTVVTTHSWNTIKDTDASASTSSSSALDNPYFENNGRVQFTWFGLDGYVGTSTGGVISILDWRFTYLEISPLAVGYNYIPEYAANLNWPALGRSSEGFYYQPSLKFYIPLGSTGCHALTLAGGARLMIEDLRSIRTLAFDDPWFMAEIGYNFNAGLINTNVFARYNGDFVIGLQLKLCHVFTPKQQ